MIPIRIICIGASSIQGRVDPEGGGWVGRLRKWHESNSQHNVVYNLGISGETTADFLKRIKQECKPREPDLMIFSLSTNDSRRVGSANDPNDTPRPKYQRNIKKLIDIARGMAEVVFVDVYPFDDSKTCPVPWDREKYYLLKDAQEYRDLAKATILSQNAPFLDIWSDWEKKDYQKLLCEDGLHANGKGHQRIFESVKGFLKDLYSKR